MTRIGSSFIRGPVHEVQLSPDDFQRIRQAPGKYESRTIKLSDEVQDELVEILQTYVCNKSALPNEPTWREVEELVERPLAAAEELIRNLNAILARFGKSDRERKAMEEAERLISVSHGSGINLGAIEEQLYRLVFSIRKSLAACERYGGEHRGRERDEALCLFFSQIVSLYRRAGGRSVSLQSRDVDRPDETRETKISGCLIFAHECLKTLPQEFYRYHDHDLLESTALAKMYERRKPNRKKPVGSILDAILEAKGISGAAHPQNKVETRMNSGSS